MFHVQTKRGEAVAFTNQGHNRDMLVVSVWEEGKAPLERRWPAWSYEAGWFERAVREMVSAR